MPNWNYTHGDTSNRNRLRFLLGDHRGTSGAWTGTNQMYSDEELDDVLLISGTANLLTAARICIQSRINREALAAGVSGTTDTTDRPAALVAALRALDRLPYPGKQSLPQSIVTTDDELDREDMEKDEDHL
jgi:hypothetical protein